MTLPLPCDCPPEEADAQDPLEEFDTKALPSDDRKQLDVWNRLLLRSIHRVNGLMVKNRGVSGAPDAQVQYTQGQHVAITTTIARMFTDLRFLSVLQRDKRDELEARLLARIEALEARPALKYAGTWNPDTQFDAGDIATDHGSAWHCNRSTRSRPPSADWSLMCKKGRDGKDAAR